MLPLSVISVPMSVSQVNVLRQPTPFLYQLLTTSAITTPLLQKALGKPLQSQQHFTIINTHLHRHNHLYLDTQLIELAEIHFTSPYPEWSHTNQPLGPWLVEQEFQIQKKYITPLHFPFNKTIQPLFSLTEPQSCYGRRYEFHVTKKNDSWNLPLIEVWNPCLYSLPFTPLA